MIRTVTLYAALFAGLFLAGCGTSSEGSRYNDQHGVAQDSGYPGGHPTDADSPALGALPAAEKGEGGKATPERSAVDPSPAVKQKSTEPVK